MRNVFVLDTKKIPLMPCHPARARQLLRGKKAAVYRKQPFTIIMHEREGGALQPIEEKVTPGSKTSGIALVGKFKQNRFSKILRHIFSFFPFLHNGHQLSLEIALETFVLKIFSQLLHIKFRYILLVIRIVLGSILS